MNEKKTATDKWKETFWDILQNNNYPQPVIMKSPIEDFIIENFTPNSELERIKTVAQIEALEDVITICSSNGLDSKNTLVQDLQEKIISHRQLNK